MKNYKTTENKYGINGKVTNITILNKKGKEFIVKIDTKDMEKVKSKGIWFAEWNKDFNKYSVQNLIITKKHKKVKSTKQSLQCVILDEKASTPIKYVNGDMLDNRVENLRIVDLKARNEYEILDENTVSIKLLDKNGKDKERALISTKDLELLINDKYTWMYEKGYKQPRIIANTLEGKIVMSNVIMNPNEEERVHHINLNPLDNRRQNLENKLKEIKAIKEM